MIAAGQFTVAPDHPALAGHFPGNPVVPGVVLVDHAATLVLEAIGGYRLAGLPVVKFLRPVRPGETLAVTFDPALPRVAFACYLGEEAAVRGTLLLADAR